MLCPALLGLPRVVVSLADGLVVVPGILDEKLLRLGPGEIPSLKRFRSRLRNQRHPADVAQGLPGWLSRLERMAPWHLRQLACDHPVCGPARSPRHDRRSVRSVFTFVLTCSTRDRMRASA